MPMVHVENLISFMQHLGELLHSINRVLAQTDEIIEGPAEKDRQQKDTSGQREIENVQTRVKHMFVFMPLV